MMIVNYDSDKDIHIPENMPIIFLAGPTVRSHQTHLVSWRKECLQLLKKQGFNGCVVVPEFDNNGQTQDDTDWIPMWEQKYLHQATCILFWVARTKELIGLTTNCEFGFWLGYNPSKMVYGRPQNAYRVSYLDKIWKVYTNGHIYHHLEFAVIQAIEYANNAHRKV